MIRSSIVSVLVAALAFGCGSKDEKGGGGGGAPAAVKLPKLGLTLDVPGSVDVSDAIGGEGHMLMGSGVGALNVTVEAAAQTVDAAKEDAKMYSPKNLKTEALADGWSMTFENKGAMGTNHWVEVRRTIDGKNYKCGSTGPEGSQAAAVLAACKSLRKG